MVTNIIRKISRFEIDWILLGCCIVVVLAGLITMTSIGDTGDNTLFTRQMTFVGVSLVAFFGVSRINIRLLRDSRLLVMLYGLGILSLMGLFVFGATIKGSTSWYQIAGFSLQPSDPIKIILILVLAKYLSRRHIELRRPRHIIITGLYFLVPFLLIFLQPDFGSAIILGAIWLGMILVAGISWKHLLVILGIISLAGFGIWNFAFEPYQQDRIATFLQPLSDIQGAGYNAYQSTIAVGSGKLIGKGVGYGTQSRLAFLPENETDFIFASFAEEWGFVGSLIILVALATIIWRVLRTSLRGASNFETLYGVGLAIYLVTHIVVNVGMNLGVLPVTGIPLPLMSYGGSHLLTEFIGLGILMGMYRYSRDRRAHDRGVTVL